MSTNHHMQCPDCGHSIFYNTVQLLAGESFSCSNPGCNVSVSLSANNNDKSRKAIEEFNKQRGQINGSSRPGMA